MEWQLGTLKIYTKCKPKRKQQKKKTKESHEEDHVPPQTPPPNIAKTTQPLNLAGLKEV
jgi:hypothetical protein